MLYHISMDISLEDKVFKPRIPKFRLPDENKTIKRISFGTSIENCLEAFPYKDKVMLKLLKKEFVCLCVYNIDEVSIDKRFLLEPNDLVQYVEDASETQEHWILKDCNLKPSLIRLRKIVYQHTGGKYSGPPSYGGPVVEMSFEHDVEDYDRPAQATFYTKKLCRQFIRACNRNGILLQPTEKKRETMDYFGVLPSSRVYTVYRVPYCIPANVSAKEIWYIIDKEIKKYRHKCPGYGKNDYM